jgi:ribosomal RNA-processing protein 1
LDGSIFQFRSFSRPLAHASLKLIILLPHFLSQDYWMCDKPENQADLADRLAELISAPHVPSLSLLYIRSFFYILNREWEAIDSHRIDKFFKLLARMLEASFDYLRSMEWDLEIVKEFGETILKDKILEPTLDGHAEMFAHIEEHFFTILWEDFEDVCPSLLHRYSYSVIVHTSFHRYRGQHSNSS